MSSSPVLIFDFPQRMSFDDPLDVLVAHDVDDVRRVLRAVDDATKRGLYAAGFVSYEAAPAFDAAHVVRERGRGSLPLAWFGVYAEPSETMRLDPNTSAVSHAWEPAIDRESYDGAIARIRGAIAEGDVYQVNFTFPLASRSESIVDHRAFYERLARAGHGRYNAYLDIGTHCVLSFSPELFFSREGDRLVCRPMKGTIARGRWPEEDAARAAQLRASVKDRAENVMIVDLVRNDLGRVARLGSVRVTSLCELERYPTVWQMTSTIEARARPGTTMEDLFGALFPCGSVTGAPKISAMRHIADLESAPRGVYCGAIGVAGPEGATFNVAIRTMTIDVSAGTAAYPVGGGVTWDSAPHAEYAEALAKAALLRPAPRFSLLETMRLEVRPASASVSASAPAAAPEPHDESVDDARAGRFEIPRLERHLARLAASARDRDIPIDLDAIRERLRALAPASPRQDGTWRVRLLVSQEGRVDVDVQPAPAPLTSPAPVSLATTPVDENDWFLFHKTTHREIYDRHRADAVRLAPEIFDVLLWNRRGELTELTIGNLVLSIDGRRWTPPRASGLLAGVFREELLAQGEIAERTLTREDLARADAAWLINSLREWVPLVFV